MKKFVIVFVVLLGWNFSYSQDFNIPISNFSLIEKSAFNNFDISKNYSSSTERRKFEAKGKKVFFSKKIKIMLATFFVSTTTAYLGFLNNQKANDSYKSYRYSKNPELIKRYKEDVNNFKSKRNLFYGISAFAGAGFVTTIFVF